METVYVILYSVGSSEVPKIAQIEAEDINEAIEKVEKIFLEFESTGRRKYKLIDVTRLSAVRKLDALD